VLAPRRRREPCFHRAGRPMLGVTPERVFKHTTRPTATRQPPSIHRSAPYRHTTTKQKQCAAACVGAAAAAAPSTPPRVAGAGGSRSACPSGPVHQERVPLTASARQAGVPLRSRAVERSLLLDFDEAQGIGYIEYPTGAIHIQDQDQVGACILLRIGCARQRCRRPIPPMPSAHASRP
jgi:hypothetical protein